MEPWVRHEPRLESGAGLTSNCGRQEAGDDAQRGKSNHVRAPHLGVCWAAGQEQEWREEPLPMELTVSPAHRPKGPDHNASPVAMF